MTRSRSDDLDDLEFPDFFRKLASGVPGIIFTYWSCADGRAHRYPYISSRVRDLFGIDPDELRQDASKVFERIHPEDTGGLTESVLDSAQNLTPWKFQARMRLASGKYHWFEANSMPERQVDGSTLWYGQFTDIQAHKDLEQSLRASESEFAYQARFQHLLADLSADFMTGRFGDTDRRIQKLLADVGAFFEVDRAYLYAFSDNNSLMTNTHEWCREGVKSLIDTQQRIPICHFAWWHRQMDSMIHDQRILFIEDVSELPEDAALERGLLEEQGVVSLFNVPVRSKGLVSGFFGMDMETVRRWREDQTDLLIVVAALISGALDRDRLEQELVNQSIRDPLTGLHNRRYLFPRIDEMIGAWARERVGFALAMFDIDHFKHLNDTWGHLAGDYVLREFTALMVEMSRSSDVIVRYGGEEFVVLFAAASRGSALGAVERLLSRVRQHGFDFQGQPLSITVSAGLVHASDVISAKLSAEMLIEIADQRLYHAKRTGRNRVVNAPGSSSR